MFAAALFSSQKVGAAPVAADGWADKQNEVCTQWNIISLQKGGDPDTGYGMDRCGEHHSK